MIATLNIAKVIRGLDPRIDPFKRSDEVSAPRRVDVRIKSAHHRDVAAK